jgi:predicted membrane protein
MNILFIITLIFIYALNYFLKYFIKASVFFAGLKLIKKTFFKDKKKKDKQENKEIQNSDVYSESSEFLKGSGYKISEYKPILTRVISENKGENIDLILQKVIRQL